jgi:hypothetical protein
MAQRLTFASIRSIVDSFGWTHPGQWLGARRHAAGPGGSHQRPVYRASAQEFLHGAADLTFGLKILGLGFFMLMWVIATA